MTLMMLDDAGVKLPMIQCNPYMCILHLVDNKVSGRADGSPPLHPHQGITEATL